MQQYRIVKYVPYLWVCIDAKWWQLTMSMNRLAKLQVTLRPIYRDEWNGYGRGYVSETGFPRIHYLSLCIHCNRSRSRARESHVTRRSVNLNHYPHPTTRCVYNCQEINDQLQQFVANSRTPIQRTVIHMIHPNSAPVRLWRTSKRDRNAFGHCLSLSRNLIGRWSLATV